MPGPASLCEPIVGGSIPPRNRRRASWDPAAPEQNRTPDNSSSATPRGRTSSTNDRDAPRPFSPLSQISKKFGLKSYKISAEKDLPEHGLRVLSYGDSGRPPCRRFKPSPSLPSTPGDRALPRGRKRLTPPRPRTMKRRRPNRRGPAPPLPLSPFPPRGQPRGSTRGSICPSPEYRTSRAHPGWRRSSRPLRASPTPA